MKVLFEDSKGVTHEIAIVDTIGQGLETIENFCQSNNIELHNLEFLGYSHSSTVTIDINSPHYELFYIVADEYEDENESQKLTQEEAIELAYALSDALASVGVNIRESDGTLKSLSALIAELPPIENAKK